MSDYSISSISSVRPVDAGASLPPQAAPVPKAEAAPNADSAASRPGAQTQAESAAAKAATIPAQADPAALKQGAPALPKPEKAEEKPLIPVNNGDNVAIHFKVDAKTHNITVFVVDRQTRRVLRSIPPEELNKLQTGDLLELTA
jgi:hypothetical protein